MKICIIAGARPNFMKIGPIIEALRNHNQKEKKVINYLLVHTGQHYDKVMSRLFFDELGIPNPDVNLEVGSASHAVQTAEIMKRYEEICLKEKPTHTLVVGDVNSTIACALVASKLGIKVIHVEAGLRSFDRSMPEEINRVLTDSISDVLFTTEERANQNLLREGILKEKIFFVGNVMIDTLKRHYKKSEKSEIILKLGLMNGKNVRPYGVLTLHRPSNVDEEGNFKEIIQGLQMVSNEMPIIFPAHPRTIGRIREFGFGKYFAGISKRNEFQKSKGINLINPLGYLDFLRLMSKAKIVISDSGGIQEETTILRVPCVTVRENTERPVTVTKGTNIIAGIKRNGIMNAIRKQLAVYASNSGSSGRKGKKPPIPPLWDGKAAIRIVKILAKEVYKS